MYAGVPAWKLLPAGAWPGAVESAWTSGRVGADGPALPAPRARLEVGQADAAVLLDQDVARLDVAMHESSVRAASNPRPAATKTARIPVRAGPALSQASSVTPSTVP